jgi:poly(A) polymerase
MTAKPLSPDFRTSEPNLPSASELRKSCPHALAVVQRLVDAGFEALFAGGCVRDLLLGRPFKDIDIASNASPDQVEALFERTHAIGKSFGVIQVVIENEVFEVAAFRQDLAYHDGRRPEGYLPTTPEEDAKRRDFSINGLFLNPLTGELLDFVGGREDLRSGLIRAIGNPAERFAEDHLRLLRAVRFASVLGFHIEPETFSAIQSNASLLGKVSVERIRTEFSRILTESPRAGDAVALLDACGLLKVILPEFLDLKDCTQPPEYHPEGDVWTHTLMMLNGLDHPSEELAFSVLLHDIGKPATRTEEDGRIRFRGHAQVGADIADRCLKRMKFSKASRQAITGMVDRHMNFMNVSHMRKSTRRRMVAHPDFIDELELHRLDCLCSNGITLSTEILQAEHVEFEREAALPDPLVSGRDLLDLGVPHGPRIGEWKQKAYEEQLEHSIASREDLLDWVRRQLAGS